MGAAPLPGRAGQLSGQGLLEAPVVSETTSFTPARPRATRPRRTAFQPAPSSLVTTSRPSTSRLPWALTALAITVATFTTRPPSRQRWLMASSQSSSHSGPQQTHVRRFKLLA